MATLFVSSPAFDQVHLAHIAQRRIAGDAARLDRRLGEQRLRADFAARQLDVVERDAAAALGELERNRATEPRRAAGHDDDATPQSFRVALGLGSLLYRRGGGRAPPSARRPGIGTRGAQGVRTYVRT